MYSYVANVRSYSFCFFFFIICTYYVPRSTATLRALVTTGFNIDSAWISSIFLFFVTCVRYFLRLPPSLPPFSIHSDPRDIRPPPRAPPALRCMPSKARPFHGEKGESLLVFFLVETRRNGLLLLLLLLIYCKHVPW